MQIKAAVSRQAGSAFSIEHVEIEQPRDDEILVAIRAVGLCHTDVAFRDGSAPYPLPAVFGHEGAGVVEAVGRNVTTVKPGDHVLLTFDSCGSCPRCEGDQLPAYCQQLAPLNFVGNRPDGSSPLSSGAGPITGNFFGQSSFASMAITHPRNTVVIPRELPFALAAPLGCGIQTGAGAVLNSLNCPPGTSLLVGGAGPVGLSAVMAAVVRGCHPIIVADPLASRREMALALGATHVIDPVVEAAAVRIREILPHGVDYAFDTSGRADMLDSIMDGLGSHGTLGVVAASNPAEQTPPGTLVALISRGLTIKGIIEGDADPQRFIPELIDYVRSGRFPLDRIVTTFPFDQINEAVEAQHRGECVKAVLEI